MNLLNATINFPSRSMAQEFATEWSRASLIGYSMTPTQEDGSCKVTCYKVNDGLKIWIDNYITKLNG